MEFRSRQWSFACTTASFFTPKIWGGYVCSSGLMGDDSWLVL
jgi:hypothetical protein